MYQEKACRKLLKSKIIGLRTLGEVDYSQVYIRNKDIYYIAVISITIATYFLFVITSAANKATGISDFKQRHVHPILSLITDSNVIFYR